VNRDRKQSAIKDVRRKFKLLRSTLDERQRRLWAGSEADVLGHGGVALVATATRLAISTVRKGRDEVRRGERPDDLVRARRRGTGHVKREVKNPALRTDLLDLVDADTRGDPESPLKWTAKSTHVLARELAKTHGKISPQKVGRMLTDEGYSLQAPSKKLEGASHPDRNGQFLFINRRSQDFIARGLPVLSVDTKKKELVGKFKTGGREWRRKGEPIAVNTHDFADQAIGKAIPYGIFDVVDNSAYVNVGVDHDTPAFAVRSIELWWERMGATRYPNAKEIFITADAGGSNSYRSRMWKLALQRLADRLQVTIHVSHFPPGTSKWNKIEHRLFSFITLNWRGRPLTTFETIINLIGSTTTTKGLHVTATLDECVYPLGESVSDDEMQALALARDEFHGEWNYSFRPRVGVSTPSPSRPLKERVTSTTKKKKPTYRSRSSWAPLQSKIRASGLSLAEYCRREGLSYSAISKQRSRLKTKAAE
jgi:hypothetical protein